MKVPEGITIRPARNGDVDAIASIVRKSFTGLPARHIPFDMPLYHGEHHRQAMGDPSTRWALMVDHDRPVGVAMWRVLKGLAHLHLLFVAADRQGKGLGSLLLRHHQQAAVHEFPDTRLFTLHCLRDSHWAVKFYRRHGYTVYEPGDEGRVPDLHIWIDACRRHDNGWPLKADKALFYKRAIG